MTRLDRYLGRTILLHTLSAAGIFILLFGGYTAALFLARAVEGTLPATFVTQLVVLKLLIALEVILPIALYLGIVLALSRFSSTSELIAMEAVGYSRRRLYRIVLLLAGGTALLTALLSLKGRPWAYRRSEQIAALAKARFDIAKMEERRFFVTDEGRLVLFAEAVDQRDRRLKRAFFQKSGSGGRIDAIYAQRAEQRQGEETTILRFYDGYAYHLDPKGANTTVRFRIFDLHLSRNVSGSGYRSKTVPLGELWRHRDRPKDLAELEWRCSRPLSAIVLALLAVPLGYGHPRQGRSGRLFVAVLLFSLYYNLAAMAKTWVKEGIVGALPGLFWPELLFLLIVPLLWRWSR